MFQKVLVAVDGSPASLKAAGIANQLIKSDSLEEVTLLSVVHFPAPTFLGDGTAVLELPGEYHQMMRESAQQVIGQARAQLPAEANVKERVEMGNPAEIILDVAHQGAFDLIIIGNRGLSQIQRLFMGSVSNKVVSLAHCPVLVVK